MVLLVCTKNDINQAVHYYSVSRSKLFNESDGPTNTGYLMPFFGSDVPRRPCRGYQDLSENILVSSLLFSFSS